MIGNADISDFACQHEILLSPGSYFHVEHCGFDYPSLPQVLQQAHNLRLLRHFQLPMPDKTTQKLPHVFACHWAELPSVAWALGVMLHPMPLPWWLETSKYAQLHYYVKNSVRYPQEELASPQMLLATGATQLLASLSPFGEVYTSRALYMFSSMTQRLMKSRVRNALPWNVIEGACRYVTET